MTRNTLKKMLKDVPLPCTVRATETVEGTPPDPIRQMYLQTPTDVQSFVNYANIKLNWTLAGVEALRAVSE